MKKIAIFASGSGSNAEKICAFFSGSSDVSVVLIGTNNAKAPVLDRAKKLNIPFFVFSKKDLVLFTSLQAKLASYGVDYIILAGFLLKIPTEMISLYKNKILNIHPSLLPKYGGKGMFGENVHRAVLENKEKVSGISIHLVNQNYDKGRILFQKSCPISPVDTIDSLSKKITSLEHSFFAKTIEKYIKNENNHIY